MSLPVFGKFPRYDNEEEARMKLVDAVLDEVSDVKIILDHVQNIFKLSDEEVLDRMKERQVDLRDGLMQVTACSRLLLIDLLNLLKKLRGVRHVQT